VQVGLQRHHEPCYQAIIKQCQDGAIGDIVLTRAYWNNDGVWVRPRDPKQTELEYQCRNWYYFNWLCGDHINEQHIHNLDVINWLMNDFPTEAQGQGGRQVRVEKQYGEIYDHHFVEFTYKSGTKLLSQCRHQRNTWSSVSEFAHGSKGHADLSGGKIYDVKGQLVWESEDHNHDGWQQEHHDLFHALRAGERPNEGDYGAKSTMTAIFGRMATYTGKMLTWDQAFNSDVVLCDVDSLTSFEQEAPVKPNEEGFYAVALPGVDTNKYI
jgi:predicted dehydrogenase